MDQSVRISPLNSRFDNGQVKYFISYFGDIYHGYITHHPEFDDRFFIVSKNEAKEFRALKQDERTLENYQRLAHEIRDDRIIIGTLPGDIEIGVEENTIDLSRQGNQKWKRMFVFGAGASTHCLFGDKANALDASPFKPPMGNEIFDDRYNQFIERHEGARLSIPFFKSRGNDIEACLEKEWGDLRNAYNPNMTSRHINLMFYMQSLFHWVSSEVNRFHYHNNLYSLFANKLQSYLAGKNERIAITSFNYDTILDHFLEKVFRFTYAKMDDYVDCNNRQILLFKPHGSCNWGWQATNFDKGNKPRVFFQEELYNNNIELWKIYYDFLGDFNSMIHARAWGPEKTANKNGLGKYTVNKNKIELIQHNTGRSYFPALLMPYRDKDEFVMHYDHQNAMQWFAGEMEELYLIGWKGNEDVFNRMLKTHAHNLRKIVIVNPMERTKQEVSSNMRNYLDLENKIQVEAIDTFEDFVLNEMDKIFIN